MTVVKSEMDDTMTEAEAKRIADSAELIVGGYAMEKHDLGIRIVNLHSGNVLIISTDYKVLETSMEDLEIALAIDYLKTNRRFMSV